MKNFIATLLILGICTFSFGQTDPPATLSQEIGFDATQLIDKVFNFGGDNFFFSTPYYLTYRKDLANSRFRAGLGIRHSRNEEEGGINSNTDFITNFNSIDLRVGLEKVRNAGKRWEYFYGGDVLLGYGKFSRENTSNSFIQPDENTRTIRFGFGPVLGLRFKINEWLNLGTETALYYQYSNTKLDYEYPNNAFEPDGKENSSNLRFNPPTILYLGLRL